MKVFIFALGRLNRLSRVKATVKRAMDTNKRILFLLVIIALVCVWFVWSSPVVSDWSRNSTKYNTDDLERREKTYDRLPDETIKQFDALQAKYEAEKTDQTLRQVLFIHRHGDRFVEDNTLDKDDPLKNQDFWKVFGLGRLTTKGRERTFRLGQLMQAKYGKFLETQIQEPSQFLTKSSTYARCIESGEIFREGLLNLRNPSGSKLSGPVANFLDPLKRLYSAGSYRTESRMLDGLIGGDPYCEKYDEELQKVYKSEETRKEFDKYKDLAELVGKKIGFKIEKPGDWFSLQSLLGVENTYYPDLINRELMDNYQVIDNLGRKGLYLMMAGNQELVKLNGGLLANDILSKLSEYVRIAMGEGDHSKNLTKFVQYSTHDTKVAAVLSSLNVFDSVTYETGFNANVAIELHQELDGQKQYYVKIFYMGEVPTERIDLTYKACKIASIGYDDLCTLDKLSKVLTPVSISSWVQYQKECRNKPDRLDPFAYQYDF